MIEKILLVDDEPNVLQGYHRLLHQQFKIETSVGGKAALIRLSVNGPYAVVVSDMRMPEMDGVQLLAKIKELSPETIRIMLTGNADIQTAVGAVNEGNIFRFLTKPCSKDLLAKTLTAGLVQYQLVNAEKELLEQTLSGSIHVLTEVLSLVSPAAFGRALRLRRYIRHIVTRMSLGSPWKFEVAAMMSQLGCVTLAPETIDAVYAGRKLPPEEQALYDKHPMVAHDLLTNIPRMEPIAWMIAHQNQAGSVEADIADPEKAQIRLGADILSVTLAFDELLRFGHSRTEAAHRLARQHRDLDRRIFEALVELEPEIQQKETRTCAIEELAAGMILEQEVRTDTGLLVVAKGQEVTLPLILKLKTFHGKQAIDGTVMVSLPISPAASRKAAGV